MKASGLVPHFLMDQKWSAVHVLAAGREHFKPSSLPFRENLEIAVLCSILSRRAPALISLEYFREHFTNLNYTASESGVIMSKFWGHPQGTLPACCSSPHFVGSCSPCYNQGSASSAIFASSHVTQCVVKVEICWREMQCPMAAFYAGLAS